MASNKQKLFIDVKKRCLEDQIESSLNEIPQKQESIAKDEKVSRVAGKVACALLPAGATGLVLGVAPVLGVGLVGMGVLAAYDSAYAKYDAKQTAKEVEKLANRVANSKFELGVINEMESAFLQPKELDPALFGDEAEIHPAVNIDISPKADASFSEVSDYYRQKLYVNDIAQKIKEAGFVDENGNPWINQDDENAKANSEDNVASQSIDFESQQ